MAAVRESLETTSLNLKYWVEHGVNIKTRTILLTGSVDSDMFSLVETALTELERYNQRTVTIRINSEGGDVTDALAIVGRIRNSKVRIIVEAYGACQSAATLILAAGDKRRISRYCLFMHHESSYSAEGRHSNIKAEVMEMDRQEKLWARWMGEFSLKPAEFWENKGRFTDIYFTPEQLLALGVVDSII